jgi:hypothetical protein
MRNGLEVLIASHKAFNSKRRVAALRRRVKFGVNEFSIVEEDAAGERWGPEPKG